MVLIGRAALKNMCAGIFVSLGIPNGEARDSARILVAVDARGLVTGDPVSLLEDMLYQRGGGLLPLGGEGEDFGGHKGYGLAVMVGILTALCSGGVFGGAVKDSEQTSARVCHFFMALRLDLFRSPEDFKRDMSRMLEGPESLTPAEGVPPYGGNSRDIPAEK
jgi:LDH2 family malate/lactate/ureidoglycolate dehydrogenase